MGRCGVRGNREGRGDLPFYGYVTALASDPIEKKPLYHFRPGSRIFSVGFAGCNLSCPFCQNYRISQSTAVPGRRCSPEELAALARRDGFDQIAYTYSEPLVHAEYLIDSMSAAREEGIAGVLVSNGCVKPETAAEVLALAGAVNVDLKSFSYETYAKFLGGNLGAVLDFIRLAWVTGTHLEVTTLIVPDLNDKAPELEKAAAFLAGISPEIPWHLSAYYPAYRWKSPATAADFVMEAARRAREILKYVYTGNLPGEVNETPCPHCGEVLVSRREYRVDAGGLVLKPGGTGPAYHCRYCGEPAPFRF